MLMYMLNIFNRPVFVVNDDEKHLRLGDHFQGGHAVSTKNIFICISREYAKFVNVGDDTAISILRVRGRSQLFTLGLVGKVEVYSSWTEKEMLTEISDMFLECFTPIPNALLLSFTT